MRLKIVIPVIAGILFLGTIVGYSFLLTDTDGSNQEFSEQITDENVNLIDFDSYSKLFKTFVDKKDILSVNESMIEVQTLYFELRPNLAETYNKIGLFADSQNTIVIVPIFTATAYSQPGFYDYYSQECDSICLTVKIVDESELAKTSSEVGVKILRLLGYQTISDVDLDKDPSILENYDKVILLHNEYVTSKMFEAIINHPKVLYLYPNALYAEIETDYKSNTIKLIRGHGYPQSNIINGFDWEFDNTHPFEFDTECLNWQFYEIKNGIMLNCYPEFSIILHDEEFLQTIKEY